MKYLGIICLLVAGLTLQNCQPGKTNKATKTDTTTLSRSDTAVKTRPAPATTPQKETRQQMHARLFPYIKEENRLKYGKQGAKAIAEAINTNRIPPNPFKNLNYRKVVLYKLAEKRPNKELLFKSGTNTLVATQGQKELTKAEANEFVSIIGDAKSYGQSRASCFSAHHGVVFYDAQDHIIGHVAICLGCNWLNSHPFIRISWFNTPVDPKTGLISMPPREGFSKTGRKKLWTLFKKCGLPLGVELHSSYD